MVLAVEGDMMTVLRSRKVSLEVVVIPTARARLAGFLSLPPGARGLVLFSHGRSEDRFHPGNTQLALALNQAGLGTLICNLVTFEEAQDGAASKDMTLLASRLQAVCRWLELRPEGGLSLGIYGSEGGALPAMRAALSLGGRLSALVASSGDFPSFSEDLGKLRVPTLLLSEGEESQAWTLPSLDGGCLVCHGSIPFCLCPPGTEEEAPDPGLTLVLTWFSRYLTEGGSLVEFPS